jgi:predicted 3-demethylubiquinone-9 3-methyltransferase (glyoxalase superfamily)
MTLLSTCLWFDGNADAAADHYIAIFPNSRRTSGSEYGEEGPGDQGTTMVVNFELDGVPFMGLNGGPTYQFTPAISFVVNCDTQEEVDHYWDRLVEGGKPVQCGWLVDKFGVSWQIVPKRLGELMSGPDAARSDRVMGAMLKMIKLDIAELEAAADADEGVSATK